MNKSGEKIRQREEIVIPSFLKPLVAAGTLLVTVAGANAADLKIGVIMSTTGPSAFIGVPVVNGIRLAIDDLEKGGFFGTNKVTWMFQDNRSDKHETNTLITRLVQSDDVLMVIGPVSSAEALAAAPLAVDLKVPIFTTGTSPQSLKAGPWIFKSTENADAIISPLAEFAATRLKPKACYLVHIRDNDAYLLYSNIFAGILRKHGIEVVAQDSILSSDSDFTALATKIASSRADCLYLSTPPENGANIVVQARQAGLSAATIIVGNQNMISPGYTRTGGKAVDGTYLAAEFAATNDNAVTKDFVGKYKARYGTAPDSWAGIGYSMALITATAVKNAGANPTRQSVRDAMAASKDVPVVVGRGKWSLDADRIPTFGSIILKIRDGVAVPVD